MTGTPPFLLCSRGERAAGSRRTVSGGGLLWFQEAGQVDISTETESLGVLAGNCLRWRRGGAESIRMTETSPCSVLLGGGEERLQELRPALICPIR